MFMMTLPREAVKAKNKNKSIQKYFSFNLKSTNNKIKNNNETKK